MEENQYLIWMKRKQVLKSHIQAPFFDSYNNNSNFNSNSWEERAFAEDAARILGGCIWPPRSYSCNFCKREFRSAQALGGHMNVHRRDRARLKQSFTPHHHHHQNHDNDVSSSSLTHHHQHQQQNKNNNDSSTYGRSKTSNQEEFFQQDDHNMSDLWGQKMMVVSPDTEQQKESETSNKGYYDCVVETSLSVGLNSVIGQKVPNDDSCDHVGEDEEDTSYYKRPKKDSSSSMSSSNSITHSVFLKPCSNDNNRCLSNFHHHQSAGFVLGIKPGMEDLDLELRLGKLPQKA